MSWLPPWSLIEPVLRTHVLPGAGVAAATLAITCALTRSSARRIFAAAAGLAGGWALGNFNFERDAESPTWSLVAWWSVEPGWSSLFPTTLVALMAGVVAAFARGIGWWSAFAIRALAALGCGWWLAPEGGPFSRSANAALIAGSAIVTGEGARWLGHLAGGGLLVLAIPWGGAAATVLIYAHSALFCDLATLLTAALCGAGIASAIWKVEPYALLTAPAVFFPALMFAGATNTYSEVPIASFALAGLVPAGLLLLWIPAVRRWPRWVTTLAAIALLAIPCIVAVALAMHKESLDFGE
jgi:hypothetical protein